MEVIRIRLHFFKYHRALSVRPLGPASSPIGGAKLAVYEFALVQSNWILRTAPDSSGAVRALKGEPENRKKMEKAVAICKNLC